MSRSTEGTAGSRPTPRAPLASAVSGRAMVVTTDGLASDVGLEVLRAGGNAVDAAVAVSFALAVVNPEAGNIGGGGFLLARAPDGELRALDYRSTAPSRARPDMFSDAAAAGGGGSPSVTGHRAVAVPGAVRGLEAAHRRLGRLSWASLVEPAIGLAGGFEVRPRFVASFTPEVVAGLRGFPESARVFLPREGARPAGVGEAFRQPELARSLERIRDDGADGFYRGETADLVVAEMRRRGGLVDHGDLEGYRAEWRSPLRFPYRGVSVVSTPPASSGGVTLAAAAGILAERDLGALGWHGTRHVHLLCEAWKRAYADRNHYLADPDFAEIPIGVLVSPEYAGWRAEGITPERATPSDAVGPGVAAFLGHDEDARGTGRGREGRHTTHVSIVDPDGGAVSLTTTLNTWYGSKVVIPGTGILMNNEMDDFTTAPGRPNFFGLVQGEANAIEPGKRMLSAMTPTLVLDPEDGLSLVLGTPGGATIITTVFQVISNVVDFGMSLGEAVRAPRLHHQHLPDRIDLEPGALGEGVVRKLASIGHEIHRRDRPWGDVQAIRVTPGGLEGESDPRRGGAALGF